MSPNRQAAPDVRGKGRGRREDPFADSELFRGLSAAESRKVARTIEEKRFPRGETIFRKNDPSDSVYELKEGLVKLIARPDKGTGTILYVLRPNNVFGELLLSERKRPFTAAAVTDVVVTFVSRAKFIALLSSIPTVRVNFIRILSRRLTSVETGVSEFSHTWSYQRLAMVLLRLGEELGEETSGGTLIRLPLTHADLSGMIGTTRETATHQMNRFKRMGLLRGRGRNLVIDHRRLAQFVRSVEADEEDRKPVLDPESFP